MLHKIWSLIRNCYYREVGCIFDFFFSYLKNACCCNQHFISKFFQKREIFSITEMSFNVTWSNCTFELWQYIKRCKIASITSFVIFHSESWIVSCVIHKICFLHLYQCNFRVVSFWTLWTTAGIMRDVFLEPGCTDGWNATN